MHLTLRASASSGWLPAAALALAAAAVVAAYGVPPASIAIFAAYVAVGIALPGMLWVRLLRGQAHHIAEDVSLGLVVGYCVEIATYLCARAVGLPLLFVVWPILTLVGFAAMPGLRRFWRGAGMAAPTWWSWSLAAMLGFLLIHAATTFFALHPLTGTSTPYVDMPYHLALVGELRHHAPPMIPYVADVPLAYHWFFYADAAATSWVTGIEPLTLLDRLSPLPMFTAFVLLTASTARRLGRTWWTGPVAVAIALFGTVAGPHGWTAAPVFDSETLNVTWVSPTNLFGLALFAGLVLVLIDALHTDANAGAGPWLLIAVLVFGAAGAKASLLPLLIIGLLTVIVGGAIARRRLDRTATLGLAISAVAFLLAVVLLFRGSTGGLVVGLASLRSLLVIRLSGIQDAQGISRVVIPLVGFLVSVMLWSMLWAGAFGLLSRTRRGLADPRVLLLLGICAGGIGAALLFDYPGGSQIYFLKGAAGAFGLLATAGIAAIVPARDRYRSLIACVAVAALAGAAVVTVVRALGPARPPNAAADALPGIVLSMILPVAALVGFLVLAYAVLRIVERTRPLLRGAVPLLVVALAIGFSLPNAIRVATPAPLGRAFFTEIPSDGIEAARWLRDHSDPRDVVATNMHCRPPSDLATGCDARHFWVSGYAERRVLVEGWAYTAPAIANAAVMGVSDRTVPFWDPALLVANDSAFTDPSIARVETLRVVHGVRWLFADLSTADADGLAGVANLRHRVGDFALYEVRRLVP